MLFVFQICAGPCFVEGDSLGSYTDSVVKVSRPGLFLRLS